MQKINSKLFPFSFFLSDKKEVENMEESAKMYGGCTKNLYTDEMYSNVANSEYIKVNENMNTISLFIPDTINVSEKANKTLIGKIIQYCANRIQNKYQDIPMVENALGTWYSTDKQEVVIDNIILLSTHIDKLTIIDITYFVSLAKYIKQEMKQEGVSISVNDSLCIV
jgi:hypothetical protein